jgi:hypothetical protein
MSRFLLLAAACAVALLSTHGAAQTMYRCGSSYQDRPCSAGQASKAMGSATTAAPAAGATMDAECRQRGADAQKLAWAREAGQTQEQQFARIDGSRASASRKSYERSLVTEVYARRGSSAAVRAGIEADCVAEKQKAAETAAAAKALGLQPPAQPGVPSPTPAGPGAEVQQPSAQEGVSQTSAAREAQRKQERCASLNSQLDDVRNRQRAGGSAGTMEALSRQRRELEARLSAGRC